MIDGHWMTMIKMTSESISISHFCIKKIRYCLLEDNKSEQWHQSNSGIREKLLGQLLHQLYRELHSWFETLNSPGFYTYVYLGVFLTHDFKMDSWWESNVTEQLPAAQPHKQRKIPNTFNTLPNIESVHRCGLTHFWARRWRSAVWCRCRGSAPPGRRWRSAP